MESVFSEVINKQLHSESQNSIPIKNNSTLNTRQRLIPLTKEIIIAMMDFNHSQSSTSISLKPFYNTLSITSLVREEVHNVLQEQSISGEFIRKKEIDEIIDKCLKEKVTTDIKEKSRGGLTSIDSDTNQEIEVTVEMLTENDKNKLIVENFQILEQRITHLEERISAMLQTIPKLRHLQAKKFKINSDVIREELRQCINKMDEMNEKDQLPELRTANNAANIVNIYDDMYYEQRQNTLNLLNYKKSTATMELNERPYINPLIKPVKMELPNTRLKMKQRPMFIYNNA